MIADFFFRWDEDARLREVANAERWTERQALRLGTTPDQILETIQERSWLPEQIEAVTTKYKLQSLPPRLEGVPSFVDAMIIKRIRTRDKHRLAA